MNAIGNFIFEMIFTIAICGISFIAGVAWLQKHLGRKGLMRRDEGAYHEPSTCNRCGGINYIQVKGQINHAMCEAETSCKSCGFDDYWAYGFFQSSQEGFDFCKKYRGGES